jgi:hypothetical protein
LPPIILFLNCPGAPAAFAAFEGTGHVKVKTVYSAAEAAKALENSPAELFAVWLEGLSGGEIDNLKPALAAARAGHQNGGGGGRTAAKPGTGGAHPRV